MKKIFAIITSALVLSGCVVNVINEPIHHVRPVQYCSWVEIPVYGYADVYRSHGTTVRVQQVAYVDRQWRCHN
jgi:hypothetical protein